MWGYGAGHVGIGGFRAGDVGCRRLGQQNAVMRGQRCGLQEYGAVGCRVVGLGIYTAAVQGWTAGIRGWECGMKGYRALGCVL